MISIPSKTNVKKTSVSIPIQINNQYSLKQNFFDPTKSSPPNTFMIKLYNRMTQYETHPLQQYENKIISQK
jgi:hypothetical protein